MSQAEMSQQKPAPTIKAFGWGMAFVIAVSLGLGGLVGNKTAHSTTAPPACLAALNWADTVMADASKGLGAGGSGDLRMDVDQYLAQKAKCRDS
jgi:hypothetical protein